MPRRKRLPKVPDITDIGCKPETHIIQKSNPLLTLSETGLTLAEFKILDAYLARIDSRKPDERFVRLEKGSIEEYLGVSQIKPADLEKRIDNLFQTVTIRDKNKPKGFVKIALFEKAACYQDDDGLWQIDLGASASAMEYIFNVENIGYLRYRLKNVVNLTSRYSYVLYLYLEQNRRMHLSWEIDLAQLKVMLKCTADSYQQYYRFNELILKKCQKELHEKTECRFQYAPIKRGRKVSAIRFTLESITPVNEIDVGDDPPEQLKLSDIAAYTTTNDGCNDHLALLSEACKGEFNADELAQIYEIILTIPENKLPLAADGEDIEQQRYHYLAEKCAQMNRYKPKNRLAYLLKMLKVDVKGEES